MGIAAPKQRNLSLLDDLATGRIQNRNLISVALDRLWTFPRAGIPRSVRGVRYEPFAPGEGSAPVQDEDENEVEVDEIPLWREPVSDLWHTLNGKGPWSDGDLDERDKAIRAWAREFHYKRWRLAGFVQVIKDGQTLDGERPLFHEDGSVAATGSTKEEAERVIQQSPELREWLLALAGPSPCAERAHQAAMKLVSEPSGLLLLLRSFELFGKFIGEDLAQAIQLGLEAAFLDHRVTALGTKRPWLQNTPEPGLTLRTINLDRGCAVEDLATMWRSAITPAQMIDAGDWLTSQRHAGTARHRQQGYGMRSP